MSPHYYVIIDFECTCWESQSPNDKQRYPHEIIEFPAVFLNSETLSIDFEFHAYVRPVEQPILAPFCVELTGIHQSWVDEAGDFPSVLGEFREFLRQNRITSFTACTDGPWDFHKFLYQETARKKLPFPSWATRWIDIRQRFQIVFGLESRIGVNDMLKSLGLEFEGRPHSGIDDARNIARITAALHHRQVGGGRIQPNRNIRNRW